MKKPELLAPAGNMDSLVAAIEAGCDAVYMGGKVFGARSFASNFTNEELKKAVDYAHLYGVKVYVTVNTLIYDSEVPYLLNYVKYIHEIGVDALIMQDIGMIDLVRKTFPNMAVHASTQAHIHNLSGAKLVESLGLTRTVLARETSYEEIKHIKENTNIELEIFIHGALCISYSGQCLMSSLIGGRSGNRGCCAGSCRLQYDLVDDQNKKLNKDKYLLSTKDLNSLENIGELIDIGVDSLKIEGRMKRPEYVYAVVSLYRKAIDSYVSKKKVEIKNSDIDKLKRIFNRDFTKGFLFNEDNNNLTNEYRPNHMGVLIGHVVSVNKKNVSVKLIDNLNRGDGIRIVGKNDTGLTITNLFKGSKKLDSAKKGDIVSFTVPDDVEVNSEVLITTDKNELDDINKKINNLSRKVNIKMNIKLRIGEPIRLKIKDDKNIIEVEGGCVEEALSSPMTRESIVNQLSKLGNTVYTLEDTIIKMDDNIFVNIKDLNAVRREGIELLNKKRIEVSSIVMCTYERTVPSFNKGNNIDIKVPNIDIYNKIKNNNYHYIFIEDIELYNKINDNRKVLITPRVIKEYNDFSNIVEIGELGGLKEYNDFYTGPFLNVTNSYSLAFLHSNGAKMVTLSYEMTYDRTEKLIKTYIERYHQKPNVEVIVYGKIEAMISKYNLLKKYNVSGNYFLKDKFGNKYPIAIKNNNMVIYNYVNSKLEDNYFDIGVNNIRLDILENKDLNDIKLITKW